MDFLAGIDLILTGIESSKEASKRVCPDGGSQAAGDFLAFWPLYRVAKFDDFFSLRPKLDVPAELTGIFIGSGRLI